MSEVTVVLVGANGQLGRTVVSTWPLSSGGDTPVIRLLPLTRDDVDITQRKALERTFEYLHPQWIINCSAYTSVDRAESEPDLAHKVNHRGVENLARIAAERDSRLLHVSTDYVFDGEACTPYRTDAPTAPLGVYGASKLAGEQAVLELLGSQAVVLRTGWLYSALGHNFLLTMLRLMGERDRLSVVDDQVGTPTATRSLADVIWRMVQLDVAGGVYHWSDAGVASWYDFAMAIQEEASALYLLEKQIPIDPIPSSAYPTPARRPQYSVLDKSATLAATQAPAVHWRVNLRQVLQELLKQRNAVP